MSGGRWPTNSTSCKSKTTADWDRYARILGEYDAFDHLRSIHYSRYQYEYGRGWCTHAGVQDSRLQLGAQWRSDWGKPVVFDECRYEGNIASRWGNISGDAMTRRFWQAAAQGCYCGHGETYLDPNDTLWWSHGGVLHGASPAKIAFLRKLLEERESVGTYVGGQNPTTVAALMVERDRKIASRNAVPG